MSIPQHLYHFIFLSNSGEFRENSIKFPPGETDTRAVASQIYRYVENLVYGGEDWKNKFTDFHENVALRIKRTTNGDMGRFGEVVREAPLCDFEPKVYYFSTGVLSVRKVSPQS